MHPEERLKSYRLDAPADGLRRRVFAAIRESRIRRWTLAASAAVFAVCSAVNVAIAPDPPPARVQIVPEDPRPRPLPMSRIPRTIEEVR